MTTKAAKEKNADGSEKLDEGTPAAATLHTTPGQSKAELMTKVVQGMAKMSHEDLTDWFKKSIDLIGKEARHIPDGSAERNKASITTGPSNADASMVNRPLPAVTVVKEDLEAMFTAAGLNEDNVEKASVLFEAALNAKLAIETARIEEEFETALDEVKQELAGTVDEYLSYAADEFVKENTVAIESSIRVELVETFMEKLRALFLEHNIDVPEDKVDVVAELSEKVKDLTAQLNTEVEARLSAQKELDKITAAETFGKVAEGLADTEVEKFMTLAENVEFDGDVEDLTAKLNIIREAHFSKAKPKAATGLITEETVDELNEDEGNEAPATNREVAPYVDAISRTVRRNA